MAHLFYSGEALTHPQPTASSELRSVIPLTPNRINGHWPRTIPVGELKTYMFTKLPTEISTTPEYLGRNRSKLLASETYPYSLA
jgi:hypothetical protein